MKKALIAGVASLAIAAMPVAGVFAVTDITDNFSIGVAETCALGSDNSGNTVGQNYTATDQAVNTLVEWTGSDAQSTVLDINCNNTKGYKITPTFTGLTANDGADSITYSDTTATAGSGTWTATYVKHANGAASGEAAANFADKTAVTGASSTTDYFVITYKVGIGANQAGGTYTGTAKYELAVNS